MACIHLPCFEGYTGIAVWPAQEGVRNFLSNYVDILFLDLQSTSCYGLLDTEMILHPAPTGNSVCLPYYPSYRYVAYKAEERVQVKFYRSIKILYFKY